MKSLDDKHSRSAVNSLKYRIPVFAEATTWQAGADSVTGSGAFTFTFTGLLITDYLN
jgi:hypothetical protein